MLLLPILQAVILPEQIFCQLTIIYFKFSQIFITFSFLCRRGLVVEKRGSKDGGTTATTTGVGSGESNNSGGSPGADCRSKETNDKNNNEPKSNNNDEAVEQQHNKSYSIVTDVNNNNNENCFHHITMTSEDLLQPGHIVKERWKVVSALDTQKNILKIKSIIKRRAI